MARTLSLAAACSAAALILAPAAGAHGGQSPRGLTERQLRTAETRLLGPQHAAEHAAERASERRWRRMSPAKRRAVRAREARTALFATRAAGDPSDVGAWDTNLDGTSGFFKLPDYAINMVMLPTGKVIMWGYPQLNRSGEGTGNHGDAWLWDPSKGYGQAAFTRVTPPMIPIASSGPGATPRPVPIFCSGGSLLANGTLLVAGGNLDVTDSKGINTIFTFDPFSQTWHRQGDSPRGHWYPTQTLLPDGRTIILSGYTETGSSEVNPDFELWPARSSAVPGDDARAAAGLPVEHLTSADKSTYVYPHLFVTASGRVALTGPASYDAGLLDLSTFNWISPSPLPSFNQNNVARIGSNAVLEPNGPSGLQRITLVGGYGGTPDANGQIRATTSTLSIQPDAAAPSWSQTTSDQSVARSYANTVQLPDGSMVTVGGGAGSDSVQGGQGGWWTDGDDIRLRQVELFDPVSRTWRLGPAQQHFRAYHSTAVLLPDGRVLSAGDDSHEDTDNPGKDPTWIGNAEIYSPAYLFKGGQRAAISSVDGVTTTDTTQAARIGWGNDVFVTANLADGRPAPTRAVLVAPGAATHAVDMSQRYVPVTVKAGAGTGTLTVTAPANGSLAPPGYYMLFLLDDRGVPSVARFVQLGAYAPYTPPPPQPAGDDQTTTTPDVPGQGQTPGTGQPSTPSPKATTLRVSVRTRALSSLLRTKHLTVNLTSPRAVKLRVAVARGSQQLAGPRTVTFTKAGTRTVRITLSARARRRLRAASSRRIKIVVRFPAGQKWTVTGASALLR